MMRDRPAKRHGPPWATVTLFVGLAFALGYAFPYSEVTRNANERPRLLQGLALVDQGSFALDGVVRRGLEPGPDVARGPGGALYPNKPPVTSLVAAAALGPARAHAAASGEPLSLRRYTAWARLLGGLAPTLLLCGFLWRRFADAPGIGRGPLALGLVLYALATPANAYAHLLYGHQLAACALWIGLITVIDAVGASRPGRAFVGGLLAAAAVGVEYAAAFAGLPLAVAVLVAILKEDRHRTTRTIAGAAAIAGAAVSFAGLGWYHAVAYGSPVRTGYHHVINPEFAEKHGQGFLGLTGPTWDAFHTHVLSTETGLLWWAPLVVTAIIGLVLRARQPGERTPGRALARVALANLLLFVLIASSLTFTGGWRIGPRYMVVVLPAAALGWAWFHGHLRATWGRGERSVTARVAVDLVVAALATWAVIVNGLAANLWPHIDPTNVHQPVAEVLVPLWANGREPYSIAGLCGLSAPGLWPVAAVSLALLAWALRRSATATIGRAAVASTVLGLALGAGLVGLVATGRVFTPHPRADANLRYIERVWEPPPGGGDAPSATVRPARAQ